MCDPASVRTRDTSTEARTDCPGPPALPQRQTTSEFPRCDLSTASWPPTRKPVDCQQWGSPKEEVTGHHEGSWGLTSPSRRASQKLKVPRFEKRAKSACSAQKGSKGRTG